MISSEGIGGNRFSRNIAAKIAAYPAKGLASTAWPIHSGSCESSCETSSVSPIDRTEVVASLPWSGTSESNWERGDSQKAQEWNWIGLDRRNPAEASTVRSKQPGRDLNNWSEQRSRQRLLMKTIIQQNSNQRHWLDAQSSQCSYLSIWSWQISQTKIYNAIAST